MSAQLEPFQDSASARAELVPFLITHFPGDAVCQTEQWLRRMAYWWDENPFASAHACRGWVLRDEGLIVGYLGVIPTFYEDPSGQPIPALMATTWAIAEGHRQAALPMGLMLQRLGRDVILVDTTPSPEVQALLTRWGWSSRKQVRRSLVVRGVSAAMIAGMRNVNLSRLAPRLEITTDVQRVKSICPRTDSGAIQKHITPEYLRWYAGCPTRKHYFVGVVNQEGALSSYLMLISKSVGAVPTWKVMDWFTTAETNQELLAMIGWLMDRSPSDRWNWWPFISLAAFLPDDPWLGVPQLYERVEAICHFYSLPAALKGQPIRSVMAEGDWGL